MGEAIPLTREGGLRELRLRAQEAAQQAGHAAERQFDLVTAASEAGMNAVTHGGGTGTAWVSASDGGTVQVRVEDHGAGIQMANLPRGDPGARLQHQGNARSRPETHAGND